MTLNRCMIAVIGMDLKCPRCGLTVYSGTRHECSDGIATTEPFTITAKKRARKLKGRP